MEPGVRSSTLRVPPWETKVISIFGRAWRLVGFQVGAPSLRQRASQNHILESLTAQSFAVRVE